MCVPIHTFYPYFWCNGFMECWCLMNTVMFAEMLQEKASAVTDEAVNAAQPSGLPELTTDSAHMGLPTTPSIPSNSEPDQVTNTAGVTRLVEALNYWIEKIYNMLVNGDIWHNCHNSSQVHTCTLRGWMLNLLGQGNIWHYYNACFILLILAVMILHCVTLCLKYYTLTL